MKPFVTLGIAVFSFSAALLGSAFAETVQFRQGVDGYKGSATRYIKSISPGKSEDNGNLYIGLAQRDTGIGRGLLSFDISSLPAGATVVSAKLVMTVNGKPQDNTDRAVSIDLVGMDSDFVYASGHTWRGSVNAYSGSVLSSVVENPVNIAGGRTLTFASTDAFTRFVQDSLASGTLNLMLKLAPDVEKGSERTVFQFSSAVSGNANRRPLLEITYTL